MKSSILRTGKPSKMRSKTLQAFCRRHGKRKVEEILGATIRLACGCEVTRTEPGPWTWEFNRLEKA